MLEHIAQFFEDITLYGLEKIGLYYSQYRGFVVSIEDPDKLGRIQITVPEVHGGEAPNYWAYPASMFSGKGYGAQCLPQPNDVVWVKFEKGNVRKPIWSFGYFGKGEAPSDLVATDKYWFRTPKGLTILLDDKEGTITVYKKDGTIEPMILGDTHQKQLEDLIDILVAAKVMTQLGPQTFMPQDILDLQEWKTKIVDMKSKVTKLS